MLERVNAIIAELKTNPPPLPVDEIAEAIQFLQWLLADNFTFLGLRDYAFDGHGAGARFMTARSASCARASCKRAAARQRAAGIHAGDHGVPEGAAAR